MKRVKIAYTAEEFEEFINRRDINILQVDVKAVEQSFMFQDGFIGIVYYDDISDGEEYDWIKYARKAIGNDEYFSSINKRIESDSLFDKIKQWIHKNYGQAKS